MFWILLCGALIYLFTGFTNIGFVALDDYYDIAHLAYPAQTASFEYILEKLSPIRSPWPTAMVMMLGRLAWVLGFDSPLSQYRFSLVVWGLFSYTVLVFCTGSVFSKWGSKAKMTALLMLLSYGLLPFLLTRLMVESLCTPFLLLSSTFLFHYREKGRLSQLVVALFCLVIASQLRFQVGILLPALFMVSQRKHLLGLSGGSLLIFLALGYLDYQMKGSFHGTLLAYATYNFQHSSSYGTTPFYSFLFVLVGLSIPPVFFRKYEGSRLKPYYKRLYPVVLYVTLFVGAHSLVPHKEERFLIPVVPLFLWLLVPLGGEILKSGYFHWRTLYWGIIHGFLLVTASFTVSQRNVLGLVVWLNRHSEVKEVRAWKESLILYPTALLQNPPTLSQWDPAQPLSCSSIVAVREDFAEGMQQARTHLSEIFIATPGFGEKWIIKLNPTQNIRRSAIHIFSEKHCAS